MNMIKANLMPFKKMPTKHLLIHSLTTMESRQNFLRNKRRNFFKLENRMQSTINKEMFPYKLESDA